MSGDNSTEAGRKRSRGAEAATRKEALERLKAIRQGGLRNLAASGGGYDIRIEEPIFDTVDDDEYDAIVSRRREEARGFVVDDGEDGDLGYGDEGEEEDFTKPSGPDSTDESDDGGGFSGRLRKKKAEKKKGKEQPQVKKVNPALKAAATITGEGRLSSMFTSSSFKKGKETDTVKCEGILDEVLAEVTPDDLDRERHRRRKQPPTVPVMFSRNKNVVSVTSSMAMKDSEPTSDRVFMEKELVKEMKEEVVTESEVTPPHDSEKMELPGSDGVVEDGSNNIRQSEAKAESEVKDVFTLNATVDLKEKDSALSATAGWKEAMVKGGTENGAPLSSNCEGQTEFDLDADGSLRFYILDAYEEAFGASMGTIYLFGKVSLLGFFNSFSSALKVKSRELILMSSMYNSG